MWVCMFMGFSRETVACWPPPSSARFNGWNKTVKWAQKIQHLANGATTLSITTLSIMTFNIITNKTRHSANLILSVITDRCYAECRLWSVAYNHFMLNIAIPSVVMLSVVMLSVVKLSVVAPFWHPVFDEDSRRTSPSVQWTYLLLKFKRISSVCIKVKWLAWGPIV